MYNTQKVFLFKKVKQKIKGIKILRKKKKKLCNTYTNIQTHIWICVCALLCVLFDHSNLKHCASQCRRQTEAKFHNIRQLDATPAKGSAGNAFWLRDGAGDSDGGKHSQTDSN